MLFMRTTLWIDYSSEWLVDYVQHQFTKGMNSASKDWYSSAGNKERWNSDEDFIWNKQENIDKDGVTHVTLW